MSLIATGIVPVVLLLSLGAILRWRFIADVGFWRGLEWVVYWIFTPALFISTIPTTDLTVISPLPLLASLVVPTTVAAVLVVGAKRPLRIEGPRLTSLVQAAIRLNTYVGLVFASAMYGTEGVATFALCAAVMIPLVNVYSVVSLSIWGKRGGDSRPHILRELVTNPLILGCVIGLALNVAPLELPVFVSSTLDMLAAPALAVGCLVVGAAISLKLRWRDIVDVVATSVIKLVAMPLGAAAIAHAFDVSGATLTSIIIITALPTAPSAYVLAARMGGDLRLMAALTGAQTVLALVTMPVILSLVT